MGKITSREEFRAALEREAARKRTQAAEQKAGDAIIEQAERKVTRIASATTTTEKNNDRHRLLKMVAAGLDTSQAEYWEGGRGEYIVRMPHADFLVKVTAKKERQK